MNANASSTVEKGAPLRAGLFFAAVVAVVADETLCGAGFGMSRGRDVFSAFFLSMFLVGTWPDVSDNAIGVGSGALMVRLGLLPTGVAEDASEVARGVKAF